MEFRFEQKIWKGKIDQAISGIEMVKFAIYNWEKFWSYTLSSNLKWLK